MLTVRMLAWSLAVCSSCRALQRPQAPTRGYVKLGGSFLEETFARFGVLQERGRRTSSGAEEISALAACEGGDRSEILPAVERLERSAPSSVSSLLDDPELTSLLDGR